MAVSLVDRHGLRHEIDLDTWVSGCVEWVVQRTHSLNECEGTAEHRIQVMTSHPVHVLGSGQIHHVAGRDSVVDEEAAFAESDEPITCLQCIANNP